MAWIKCKFPLGVFILMCAVLLNSCNMYKELPVEYDFSYSGNYKKYDSFLLVDLESNTNNEFGYLIDNAIVAHMQLLGYNLDYKNPDLTISYQVFQDSLHLRGYHQQEMRVWLKKSKLLKEYFPKGINLENGTLYVQIFDTKKSQAVWQGYITNTYGKNVFTSKRQIHHAVRSILNKYQVFAQSHLKKKETI